MIKKIEDLNYYELLEINTDASSQDVHRAYERIRKIYEPNSIALYSLFSAEETTSINQRIEDAYRTLVYEETRKRYDAGLRRNQEPVPPTPIAVPLAEKRYQTQPQQPSLSFDTDNRYLKDAEPLPEKVRPPMPMAAIPTPQPLPATITEFTGSVLKILREQRNITVRNIADTTKLGTRYIEFIEAETFNKLPARAYIRGFLSLYAKALGYEPERLVSDYMKRYDAAMNPPKQK
jgi:curved DNA-binding protein CbpA